MNALGLSAIFLFSSCNYNSSEENIETNSKETYKSLKVSQSDKLFINSELSKIRKFTLQYNTIKENQRVTTDPFAIAEDFLR